MLRYHRFVLWMDASIKFRTGDLDLLFAKAKKIGVLAKYDGYLLAAHTFQDTVSFLGETPSVFRNSGEFSASVILIHSENKIIRNYFIRPWVGCALIKECMMTTRSDRSHFFNRLCFKHVHYHTCHRYDQSVFGLLMYRLFPLTYREHDIGKGVAETCRDEPFWVARNSKCDLIWVWMGLTALQECFEHSSYILSIRSVRYTGRCGISQCCGLIWKPNN